MEQFKEYFEILGRNISRLRLKKGIPQSALAKAIGVSNRTIKCLEMGVVGARFGTRQLFAIANYLGCSVPSLFTNPK